MSEVESVQMLPLCTPLPPIRPPPHGCTLGWINCAVDTRTFPDCVPTTGTFHFSGLLSNHLWSASPYLTISSSYYNIIEIPELQILKVCSKSPRTKFPPPPDPLNVYSCSNLYETCLSTCPPASLSLPILVYLLSHLNTFIFTLIKKGLFING